MERLARLVLDRAEGGPVPGAGVPLGVGGVPLAGAVGLRGRIPGRFALALPVAALLVALRRLDLAQRAGDG